MLALIGWIARFLFGFGTKVGAMWAAAMGTISSHLVALGILRFVLAIIRLAIVVTFLLAVWAAFDPGDLSITGLWNQYVGSLGTVGTYVAYFVPIGLVWALIDVYLAVLTGLIVFRVSRWIASGFTI